MQTETLDKLYLEWSQFTSARTGRELKLEAELARAREALLREWREKGSISHGLHIAAEIAQAKYKREIAQEQGR